MRRLLRRIRGAYWNVNNGVRNLIAYAPVVWRQHDFDWEFMAELIAFKAERMARHIGGGDIHTSARKDARRLMECSILLRRLIDDAAQEDAAKHGARLSDGQRRQRALTALDIDKQRQERVGYLIGRYMRSWWD